MTDLRDLYQDVILDHNKRPRNFGPLSGANRQAEGHNPLCGDRVTVSLEMEGDRIKDIAFEGAGCAISTASASLMTEALKGKRVEEARALFHDFHELVTKGEADADVGKLAVLGGVREYPMRVKCATLAWHTLQAALDQQDHPVSTE
ncbi:MAG TPA: SUF system NifU family Fe-S cluster assembly protein [Thermoanaerobaculia bacterium]|nr:SUF system NifU family Fe-S cluster assembly protein [Thermoanaerobaculia bacterium]HSN86920.1 SUF system NifU family Fe-S cluster assembly protein [Thermoanaerobaculia bacterium]